MQRRLVAHTSGATRRCAAVLGCPPAALPPGVRWFPFRAVVVASSGPTSPFLWTARRASSSRAASDDDAPPSNDDVRRAQAVLGVAAGAGQADVRARYHTLARAHHPDVKIAAQATAATASSGTAKTAADAAAAARPAAACKMADINAAYKTLQRHFKHRPQAAAGNDRNARSAASGEGSRRGFGSGAGGYGFGDPTIGSMGGMDADAWQAAMGGIPPEIFEAMAMGYDIPEEFRHSADFAARDGPYRRAPRPHGAGGRSDFAFDDDGSPDPEHQHQKTQQRQQQQQQQQPKAEQPLPAGWTEEQRSALMLMYGDGKSFEFIANALGKKQDEVVTAFNASMQQQRNGRQQQRHNGGAHRSQRGGGAGPRGPQQRRYPGAPMRGGDEGYAAGFHNGQFYTVDLDDDEEGAPFFFADGMPVGFGPGGHSSFFEDGGDGEDPFMEGEGSEIPFTGRATMHGMPGGSGFRKSGHRPSSPPNGRGRGGHQHQHQKQGGHQRHKQKPYSHNRYSFD